MLLHALLHTFVCSAHLITHRVDLAVLCFYGAFKTLNLGSQLLNRGLQGLNFASEVSLNLASFLNLLVMGVLHFGQLCGMCLLFLSHLSIVLAVHALDELLMLLVHGLNRKLVLLIQFIDSLLLLICQLELLMLKLPLVGLVQCLDLSVVGVFQ